MQKECNCKSKTLDMLEDGNCICTDCKCHYYKRETDEDLLQNKLRNYGIFIIGTSTVLFGIYIFVAKNI